MTADELRKIELFCPKEKCGDPVGGLSRSAQFHKRQLRFRGFLLGTYAKYQCPVCSHTRYLRSSLFGSYVERDTSTAIRETLIVLVALALVFAGLAVAKSIKKHEDHKAERRARENRASMIEVAQDFTKEKIAVAAERAEVLNERQIRVLVTARLRASAKQEATVFLPPQAYFLDQDGTRYEPFVKSVDVKPEEAIATLMEVPGLVTIVPGQVFRYYLVAPTQHSPYSGAPPSQRLAKLTLYLAGLSPQNVPIVKPAN